MFDLNSCWLPWHITILLETDIARILGMLGVLNTHFSPPLFLLEPLPHFTSLFLLLHPLSLLFPFPLPRTFLIGSPLCFIPLTPKHLIGTPSLLLSALPLTPPSTLLFLFHPPHLRFLNPFPSVLPYSFSLWAPSPFSLAIPLSSPSPLPFPLPSPFPLSTPFPFLLLSPPPFLLNLTP